MENLTYNTIGPVLHLNKAGELAQKRMKAAKLCDGLYITEPDKTQFVKFIVEYNGVKWVEHQAPAANINPANMAKRMPAILASIEGGRLNELNDYHKELHRRIFNPDSPAIMELKKLERKKTAPLPEGAKKFSVLMFKGCTDEIIDKKVIINEVAPHVYTYTYKLKRYGERVKIIFEIDGVYFQGTDNGAYVMEREDFNEICAKAYERARENVADGAAKGMQYFVEVQKRIDAATSSEVAQTADTDAAITLPTEDINYMFYIKPKGENRFSTYNPGKGTMNTRRVFTELYRKEHLPAVCKWIAEDKSGDFAYQLRSGDGKRIYWQHNPTAATTAETPRISTQADEPINVSAEAKEGRKEAENGKTQIQIETANKFFKREWGKHAEMLGGLAECDGNVLCFYWRSLKNIVGKVRSRTYRFYPDHYEVESNIYNIYGCFNVQSIAYNYDGSIYTPPQPPTTPPTEPNEPTAHPTPERTETTIAAIAEKATTTPTIKKNLQVGTCRKSRQVGAAARNYRIVQSAYHIAHVGKMVALTDTPSNTLRIVAYVPRKCSKANAPPIGSIQTNLY